MKLVMNIQHMTGHCSTGFQGQRLKVKVRNDQLTHASGGIHFHLLFPVNVEVQSRVLSC